MLRDPDRYSMKKGGGCLMLFGLPFFGGGLAFMIAGIMGSVKVEGGGAAPLLLVIPFSLVFVAIGAVLMFGRAGLVIDQRSRTITEWWGVLVPFKREVTPVDAMRMVTVSRETRSSEDSTRPVYPVRIEGEEGVIDVEEPGDYSKARRRAEEIAKFLGFGIEDSSSGQRVVREAGTLDMSLRDMARASGERPERPPGPPAGCRVATSAAGSEATFDLPPAGGAGCAVAIGLVMAVVPFLFFGGFFASSGLFRDIAHSWPFLAIFGAFVLIWLGAALGKSLGALKKATARSRLVVDPRELRLETRSFLGTKTVTIPAAELEELGVTGEADARVPKALRGVVGGGEYVVARSDRAEIEFGRGLSRAELEWLRDAVRFIVTS